MEFIFHYSLLIFSIILSVILLIVVLSQCILKGKIYKGFIIASASNLLLNVILALLYDNFILKNEVLKWFLCGYILLLIVVFSIVIIAFLGYFNQKTNGYEEFVSSLNKTSWNVILYVIKTIISKKFLQAF